MYELTNNGKLMVEINICYLFLKLTLGQTKRVNFASFGCNKNKLTNFDEKIYTINNKIVFKFRGIDKKWKVFAED